jgi:hypothetical protein
VHGHRAGGLGGLDGGDDDGVSRAHSHSPRSSRTSLHTLRPSTTTGIPP